MMFPDTVNVALGVLLETPAFRAGWEGGARFARIQIVPDCYEVQARIAAPGRGVLAEPEVGDEVIVLMPGKLEDSEVALAVLWNGSSPQSVTLDPTKVVLGVGKTGVELRVDEDPSNPPQGVVLAELLQDLKGFTDDLNTFMVSISTATVAAQIAAAALVLLNPVTGPGYAALLAGLLTATSGTGPPYASANIKATE